MPSSTVQSTALSIKRCFVHTYYHFSGSEYQMACSSRTMLHAMCPRATHKFLQDNNVPLFTNPPESPDCNPIENLWHELMHFIQTRVKPHNKEELIQGIETFWGTVTPETCCHYIKLASKKVISKVLEVNRAATGY